MKDFELEDFYAIERTLPVNNPITPEEGKTELPAPPTTSEAHVFKPDTKFDCMECDQPINAAVHIPPPTIGSEGADSAVSFMRVIRLMRPAVVTSPAGVVEGIFTSWETAAEWAKDHNMGEGCIRGGAPFIDAALAKAPQVTIATELSNLKEENIRLKAVILNLKRKIGGL